MTKIRVCQVTRYLSASQVHQTITELTEFEPFLIEKRTDNGNGRTRRSFAIVRILAEGETCRAEKKVDKDKLIKKIVDGRGFFARKEVVKPM